MSSAQINVAIAILIFAWLGQVVGAWFQWKNFHRVVSGIQQKWHDGHLGVGRFRKRFGFGCVSVLVVGSDQKVKELQLLKGVSVFAKFKPVSIPAGVAVQDLLSASSTTQFSDKEKLAILDAVRKIEEVAKK
ncbi:hypothetical protein LIN78_12335 [Leeia sp. TBRC 13508]|uniref:Glucitol operon activator protein n=1 Tax=Leeia speluncae TaxID=2884804 RepID=A0ABS8D8J0_9NEIS|nr:transcriptional regulator GutM [Leeia speluncae]MCB6184333.1 hypothetical protein [Leeia speluncae]